MQSTPGSSNSFMFISMRWRDNSVRIPDRKIALSQTLITLAAEGITDPQELRRRALENMALSGAPMRLEPKPSSAVCTTRLDREHPAPQRSPQTLSKAPDNCSGAFVLRPCYSALLNHASLLPKAFAL